MSKTSSKWSRMPSFLRDVLGVAARAVGQDELAAGQRLDGAPEGRVELDRRMIDVVSEVEEIVGLDAVFVDERPKGRAVAVIEILLQRARRQAVEAEHLHDVDGDALVDLRPHPRLVRIEGVVEIEDPGVDMPEAPRVGGGEVGERAHGVHGESGGRKWGQAAPRRLIA